MASSLQKVRILGICGSLRKGSFNKALLREAITLVPNNAAIEVFDLASIPPFNQDLENTPPEIIKTLKQKIHSSDAILFVTPEYNYSISGVLKNAIDWASRPYGDSAWDGKPVGIMGASGSMAGTARAQYHLRQMFVFLNMYPLNRPEVMVAQAHEKIDEKGTIKDAHTKEKIKELLEALVDWTIKLKKAGLAK